MLKRLRKSSRRVTLVLIGLAGLGALSGCKDEDVRRDLYSSKEDCLADWGHSPQDCEPAYDRPTGNAMRTYYYGRPYIHSGSGFAHSSSPHSSRAISSSSVSHGGFGSTGHSSSG
jgi:uncharacterized protein YgiB involved in biofilm formation